jgi:hypothetical protein
VPPFIAGIYLLLAELINNKGIALYSVINSVGDIPNNNGREEAIKLVVCFLATSLS